MRDYDDTVSDGKRLARRTVVHIPKTVNKVVETGCFMETQRRTFFHGMKPVSEYNGNEFLQTR